MLREKMFCIESFPGSVFEGYSRDEFWNGWACPYFTHEQALTLMEAHRLAGIKSWYDSQQDAFAFALEAGDVDFYYRQEIDGRIVYPVGAFEWIWEEYEV